MWPIHIVTVSTKNYAFFSFALRVSLTVELTLTLIAVFFYYKLKGCTDSVWCCSVFLTCTFQCSHIRSVSQVKLKTVTVKILIVAHRVGKAE